MGGGGRPFPISLILYQKASKRLPPVAFWLARDSEPREVRSVSLGFQWSQVVAVLCGSCAAYMPRVLAGVVSHSAVLRVSSGDESPSFSPISRFWWSNILGNGSLASCFDEDRSKMRKSELACNALCSESLNIPQPASYGSPR